MQNGVSANATLQAFGTQDQQTARYVSEALGQETIGVVQKGESKSYSMASSTTGQSSSTHWHGRALLQPDEVRRLAPTAVIALEQGMPPFLLERLNYLAVEEYQGKTDANPMHRG